MTNKKVKRLQKCKKLIFEFPKKHKIASSLCILSVSIFSTYCNVTSVFDKSNVELSVELSQEGKENTANMITAFNNNTEDIKNSIESNNSNNDRLDCSVPSEHWYSSNEIGIDGHFFILKDNEYIGSATFKNEFNNLFVLEILFQPSSSDYINTNISTKDHLGNEITITIGDDSFNKIKIFSTNNKNGVSTFLPNEIDTTQEFKLRIQTILKANTLRVSGIVTYFPKGKPQNSVIWDIKDYDLPKDFLVSDVSLNLGLIRNESEDFSKRIELLNCSITEK